METKIRKPAPRAAYLALVVAFAGMILWAFLKMA
ncbi:MAG: hypothetical protein PCFJNLEI_03112 [Verrucomicrobiae bacterium]|nr:hypothetical protein [Verrucomicrobiae bacterium]